jgi:hypothetical protein
VRIGGASARKAALDDAGLYWDADFNEQYYIAVAAAIGRFIESAGNECGFQAVFVNRKMRKRTAWDASRVVQVETRASRLKGDFHGKLHDSRT